MDITEFLLARIAEDEEVVSLDHADTFRHAIEDGYVIDGYPDPARVLAECQAKRAVIEQAAEASIDRWMVVNDRCVTREEREQELATDPGALIVRHLSAVYAEHPDYREEWRP